MGNTWVLVGDASRARLFSFEKWDHPWNLERELDHPAGRARTSDMVTDKAGRVQQSGGGTSRSPAMASPTDPTDFEERRFAGRLAEVVQKGLDRRAWEKLVLVAPPRFLGCLRKSMRDPVTRRVHASVGKDYTQVEARELPTLLGRDVPPVEVPRRRRRRT